MTYRTPLLGLAEICEHYDVPKGTAAAWTRRADFPEPAMRFKMGPAWRLDHLEAWRASGPVVKTIPFTCSWCQSTDVSWDGDTDDHDYYEHRLHCQACGHGTLVRLQDRHFEFIKETA